MFHVLLCILYTTQYIPYDLWQHVLHGISLLLCLKSCILWGGPHLVWPVLAQGVFYVFVITTSNNLKRCIAHIPPAVLHIQCPGCCVATQYNLFDAHSVLAVRYMPNVLCGVTRSLWLVLHGMFITLWPVTTYFVTSSRSFCVTLSRPCFSVLSMPHILNVTYAVSLSDMLHVVWSSVSHDMLQILYTLRKACSTSSPPAVVERAWKVCSTSSPPAVVERAHFSPH